MKLMRNPRLIVASKRILLTILSVILLYWILSVTWILGPIPPLLSFSTGKPIHYRFDSQIRWPKGWQHWNENNGEAVAFPAYRFFSSPTMIVYEFPYGFLDDDFASEDTHSG